MANENESTEKYILSSWRRLILDPPNAILDVIIEDVERQHRIRVRANDVTAFLKTHVTLPDADEVVPLAQPHKILDYPVWVDVNHDGPFKGKRPHWFKIAQKQRFVKSWKDLLLECSAFIAEDNPNHFDNVLHKICGGRRNYFSKRRSSLQDGRLVKGTDIYVETNLSANNIMSLCNALSVYFGYGPKIVVQTV